MNTYISITTYVLILCMQLTLTTNPHQPQNCYSMLLVSIICTMFFIMLYVRVMCSCHSCSVYRVIHVSCVRNNHVLFIVSFMCHVFVSNNVIYVSFICCICCVIFVSNDISFISIFVLFIFFHHRLFNI